MVFRLDTEGSRAPSPEPCSLLEVYPLVRQKDLHLHKLKPHAHTHTHLVFSLFLFIPLRFFEVKGLIFYYIKHECISYIQQPEKNLFAQVHPKPLWLLAIVIYPSFLLNHMALCFLETFECCLFLILFLFQVNLGCFFDIINVLMLPTYPDQNNLVFSYSNISRALHFM